MGELLGELRLSGCWNVSLLAPLGCQSSRVGRCSDFRDLEGGVVLGCLLARVFVPMVCDGSLLAEYLLRLWTLELCNKRLLTSEWRQ